MRTRFLWVVLAVLSALAFATGASVTRAVASPGAAADQTYSDPAGDASGGPDVTGITVRNDAGGTVTMVISVALPEFSSMIVGIDNNLDATMERYVGVASMGSGLLMEMYSKTDPAMALVPSLTLSGTSTSATLSF